VTYRNLAPSMPPDDVVTIATQNSHGVDAVWCVRIVILWNAAFIADDLRFGVSIEVGLANIGLCLPNVGESCPVWAIIFYCNSILPQNRVISEACQLLTSLAINADQDVRSPKRASWAATFVFLRVDVVLPPGLADADIWERTWVLAFPRVHAIVPDCIAPGVGTASSPDPRHECEVATPTRWSVSSSMIRAYTYSPCFRSRGR
jgi:hypothetical protein